MIAFINLILQLICYHPQNFEQLHTRESKIAAFKGLDFVGLVVFAGAAASLLLGISWGGQKYRRQLMKIPIFSILLTYSHSIENPMK
jgi:hypothetical protein